MAHSGIPFVVAAPSGTGKTSVCRLVVEKTEGVVFSVSHTTRASRAGETDGVDYHFVKKQVFHDLVGADAFLEWAEYNGNHYGTSWRAIETPLRAGRDALLEIEVQGARQVRERLPDARFIFLLPPSMKALEGRLRGRGTDSREQIAQRLEVAHGEIEAATEFDYAVTNDDLAVCVEAVQQIVRGEREGETRELARRFAPIEALARLRRARD